jgi:hypothetical protein
VVGDSDEPDAKKRTWNDAKIDLDAEIARLSVSRLSMGLSGRKEDLCVSKG